MEKYDNSNIESEIKFKVENLGLLKEELRKNNAKFVKLIRQKDIYFSPCHKNFAGTLKYYLRIRFNENKPSSFDYHIVEDDVKTKEFEVKIDNPEKLKEILMQLDFRIDCIVDKKREEFTLGKFNIMLDEVAGLGNFIEIESNDKDVNPEELFKMAKNLGIPMSNMVSGKGYPDMIMERGVKKNDTDK